MSLLVFLLRGLSFGCIHSICGYLQAELEFDIEVYSVVPCSREFLESSFSIPQKNPSTILQILTLFTAFFSFHIMSAELS